MNIVVQRAWYADALVAKDELKELPSWLYYTKEGEFSCYWDLVKNEVGPSSYCDPKSMVKLAGDNLEEQITKEFAGW